MTQYTHTPTALPRMTGDMEPQSLDEIVKTMEMPKPLPEPPVTCERCKDMGWLRQNVPYSDPRFGQIVKCRCRQQAQANAQKSAAYSECYTWLGDVAGDLERMTFEGFTWRGDSPSICLAYSCVKKLPNLFASKPAQGVPNLLLVGPTGVGKTHLVASLLNVLRAAGIGCLYCTAQGLFNAFYAIPFEEKPTFLAKPSTTPFLAIDELDKLTVSEKEGRSYQANTLFELLKRRYDQHLPTALLTNEQGSLKKWLGEDGAALDRLGEHCEWLAMTGTSYRQRRKDGAR